MTCAVLLKASASPPRMGRLVDIGLGGAGVITLVPLAAGARVTLGLEGPGRTFGLPQLPGVIRNVQAAEGDRQFRVSVRFDSLPGEAHEALMGWLAELEPDAPSHGIAEVRERLAAATAHLVRGDFGSARHATLAALALAPEPAEARVLLHRIDAEEALAHGAYVKASREVAIGLVHAPRDPALHRLRVVLDGMRDAWLRRKRS